jgi:hypothetical protein
MIKKAFILLVLLSLSACSFDTQEYLSQENYARYQAYYTSIFDNDRFITFTEAYEIDRVFTKIDSQYRYDIIIDNPAIAMYDIEVMVVENDIIFERAEKMMPSFGIFESLETNMIPFQVDVDKGYAKGIILSGMVDVPIVELKVMVAWKDYAKLNTTREFFMFNMDYERMQEGLEDTTDPLDETQETEEESSDE